MKPLEKYLLLTLRLLVLAAAGLLVAIISVDAFRSMSFVGDPLYQRVQTWVCYFFLFDIAVEWLLAPRKLHYLWSNLFYILVSIPYLQIIAAMHWRVPEPVGFVLRFVPLVRAAFVIGMLVGATARNRMTTMFTNYMVLLLASLYFGSLMFFIAEQPVNPGVTDFGNALWWAIMDMTTCGSSISELTPTGRVLGVVLAAEGLILFPVFTVYITSALAGNPQPAKAA
ncbi:MAG: potassium channel family protein [Bacteroides sp.]|nr:potassium channel family protein [Bacteroides sp.]MCM1379450.1 potassium channel family protein [Bacteroides sp.]MCM1445311.1 potassium channel family protein [Prevotella sp.]